VKEHISKYRKSLKKKYQDPLAWWKAHEQFFFFMLDFFIGDCWLSNLGRKSLQPCRYLHEPKMLLIGHGQS
jgi:hypothetical protein